MFYMFVRCFILFNLVLSNKSFSCKNFSSKRKKIFMNGVIFVVVGQTYMCFFFLLHDGQVYVLELKRERKKEISSEIFEIFWLVVKNKELF